MTVLWIIFLLWLIPLTRASCKIFGIAEPDYGQLKEAKNLFMFPKKVSNVESVSVCYYGTNTTSLKNVDRLQAYFIVYGPSEGYVSLTRLPQSIPQTHQKSKICRLIDLSSSYNATLQFGVFIPKDCFVNSNGTNICPLKLDFFSKSCTMLLGTTLEGMFDNQNDIRNQILQRVTSMEEVCVNLNIRIDIADVSGEAELNYGLDSESLLLTDYSQLDETKSLLVFPEVSDVGSVSVCYYGTNKTSLENVDRLQVYFVVYEPSEENVNLTQLPQSISQTLRNSKMCMPTEVKNSYNAALQFGAFIPSDCFVNCSGSNICPLKLDFFSKSCTMLIGTTLEEMFRNQSVLRNQILKHVINMEGVCLNLNIRIETQESSTSETMQWKTIVLGICFGFLLIFVVSSAVAVVWYRQQKCKGMQASIERELAVPHSCHNLTESFTLRAYCEAGPSTNNYDQRNVAVQCIDDTHDYEEPYFEPASKEEELVAQIKKLEIPEVSRESKSLRLLEVLGSGAFGSVHRGVWVHYQPSSEQQLVEEEVAVKTLTEIDNEIERVNFLQEAAIMGQFNHPNIITILGIVLDAPMMILIEMMKTGDLRNHILNIRTKCINSPVLHEIPPTLLSYSRQVASGMMYLSLKEFVHRDLAARNILISDNGACKIADFGMSRNLQDATYYKSHGGKIPVKWTAPEALHYHKYSTASDVWSYGCVLFEIWSLGYKPFHDDTNTEAIMKVGTGFRLPPPPGCPRAIYDIMMQCWHAEASQRPYFSDVTVLLQKPDFMLLNWSSEEVNMFRVEARTLGSPLEAGHQLHMDLQKTYLVVTEMTNRQQAQENSDKSQKQDDGKLINIERLDCVLESNYEVESTYYEVNENFTEMTDNEDDGDDSTVYSVKEKPDDVGYMQP